MYCPNCGTTLKKEVSFCNTCGHVIRNENKTTRTEKFFKRFKDSNLLSLLTSKAAVGVYVFAGFIILLTTILLLINPTQNVVNKQKTKNNNTEQSVASEKAITTTNQGIDSISNSKKLLQQMIDQNPSDYKRRIDLLLLENNNSISEKNADILKPIFDIARSQDRLQDCYHYLQSKTLITTALNNWINQSYQIKHVEVVTNNKKKVEENNNLSEIQSIEIPQPTSFEEYFSVIMNQKYPISKKGWVKEEFIKKFFTSPAFSVKIQGGNSNTITGVQRVDKFTESLSMGNILYTVVDRKYNSENKTTELIVKHN